MTQSSGELVLQPEGMSFVRFQSTILITFVWMSDIDIMCALSCGCVMNWRHVVLSKLISEQLSEVLKALCWMILHHGSFVQNDETWCEFNQHSLTGHQQWERPGKIRNRHGRRSLSQVQIIILYLRCKDCHGNVILKAEVY